MIQINLLPDVKQQFIKAERLKRVVISISALVAGTVLALFVLLLLAVDVAQKKNIHDLTADISKTSNQIKNTSNLDKILTIQNQLGALTSLHNQKPAANRLFGYLGQVIPASVTISNTSIDFTQNTLTLTGSASSIDNVNVLADTLKFATYTTDSNQTATKAFSAVVLTSFGTSSTSSSYTITCSFDPTIFDITKNVTLTVPNTITTRSVTGQPLFKSGGTTSGN